MPHLSRADATLHACPSVAFASFRYGICSAQMWHLEAWVADSVFPFAAFCQGVCQFLPETERRHGILHSLYFFVVVALFNDEVVFSFLIFSALLFSSLFSSYAREGGFSVFGAGIQMVIVVLFLFVFAKSFQVVW